jgi:adenosylcobinamide-phosphate synthase
VTWWLPVAAFAVDAAVGDPRWLTHPVVWMGRAINRLEAWLRATRLPARAAGVVLAATMVAGAWAVTWSLIRAAALLHPWLGTAVEVWLFSTTLAARSLAEHALAVWRPLVAGDLAAAREKLSWIVGCDTAQLDEAEVVRGAVETVAESTCDGVIAPLCWGLVGGAPLAMAYKAANTLDSMVGHKDERYLLFGWASARLDDLLNLVPARLSALLLALAAGSFSALKTALRDARKHPSPNSGWPEAAVAGALGVQLGGVNHYDGVPEQRALMGDAARPLRPADILAATRYMCTATVLAVATGTWLLWIVARR